MSRRLGPARIVLILLAAAGLAGGCASSNSHCCDDAYVYDDSYAVAPTLLFGKHPSAALATQIGREPWPATAGQVESVEDTIYVEYYRDYFGGNNWQDYNNPQRQFRSYRIGAKQR
ncbi:MAG TPA: hypothetical protein VJZ71_19580 [Phycisphaerae bacterium]|nr:hypothetical protein [Phycisphaerae bacterium]